MSRWRPPQPKSSAYITPEGARVLTEELKHLWKVERPAVTDAVHEAAKNGDRSENGDYIYGKKRLREIDRRVRYLSKRLEELTIVENTPDNTNKVYFGAWVKLEKEDGSEITYRIVGPDEFDVGAGMISMDSPLARGLLGKEVGEEATVKTAEKEAIYYISAISYQTPK